MPDSFWSDFKTNTYMPAARMTYGGIFWREWFSDHDYPGMKDISSGGFTSHKIKSLALSVNDESRYLKETS
jgi:hypothetical protein